MFQSQDRFVQAIENNDWLSPIHSPYSIKQISTWFPQQLLDKIEIPNYRPSRLSWVDIMSSSPADPTTLTDPDSQAKLLSLFSLCIYPSLYLEYFLFTFFFLRIHSSPSAPCQINILPPRNPCCTSAQYIPIHCVACISALFLLL